MIRTQPLPRSALLSIGGLLAAAVGIVIQIASGVDYPTVPPGLIILMAAAALVAAVRWNPISVLAVAVPLFLIVGGLASAPFRNALSDPGHVGAFGGSVLQLIAMGVALVGGIGLVGRWIARPRHTVPTA